MTSQQYSDQLCMVPVIRDMIVLTINLVSMSGEQNSYVPCLVPMTDKQDGDDPCLRATIFDDWRTVCLVTVTGEQVGDDSNPGTNSC